MTQATASNQGFSDQQKKELREIMSEVVEEKTVPFFVAIQQDLLHASEEREQDRADLRQFKVETEQNFEAATAHRDHLVKRQAAQQTMLDAHDRVLHKQP